MHLHSSIRSAYYFYAYIVALLLSTPSAVMAHDMISTRLSVGLWDVDGRIDAELRVAANHAADSDSDFDGYRAPRLYALVAGGERDTWSSREVDLNLNSISRSFQYSGPPDVRFFLQPPTTEEGELDDEIEPIGSIRLSGESSSYILLFVPNADAEEGYRIYPVNAGAGNVRRGELQVLNLSGRELQFAIGNKQLRLQSRQLSAVKPGSGDESFRIRIASWEDRRERWEVCFSRFQPAIREQRRLCMVVDSPRQRGGIDVRFFRIPD